MNPKFVSRGSRPILSFELHCVSVSQRERLWKMRCMTCSDAAAAAIHCARMSFAARLKQYSSIRAHASGYERATAEKIASMDTLPNEITSRVISYLPISDRLRCSMVSRRWRRLTPSYWGVAADVLEHLNAFNACSCSAKLTFKSCNSCGTEGNPHFHLVIEFLQHFIEFPQHFIALFFAASRSMNTPQYLKMTVSMTVCGWETKKRLSATNPALVFGSYAQIRGAGLHILQMSAIFQILHRCTGNISCRSKNIVYFLKQ
jgi:hypothetical protein